MKCDFSEFCLGLKKSFDEGNEAEDLVKDAQYHGQEATCPEVGDGTCDSQSSVLNPIISLSEYNPTSIGFL